MKIFTPLEQFEISVLQPISLFGYWDISFTNTSLYLVLTVFTIMTFYYFSTYKATIIPHYFQHVAELIYSFVMLMLAEQVGKKGYRYFPFLFLIFNFILFSNLLGMLPFGFTTTSQIIITFTLAFSINLGLLFIGFIRHGIGYLWFFVPSGAPKALLPLIVVIEIASYSLRTLSLSVRLFANMMAGHTLLFILCSFVMAFLGTKFFVLAIIPFVVVLATFVLEFAVAFLQAYVFTVLVCIYLNDAINMH